MKRRIKAVFVTLLLTVITIFICIELHPCSVISSTVYKNPKQTEVQLYVQVNTVLRIDAENISREIVLEHQKINGKWKQTVYEVHLYRTKWHYRMNWEYDTIFCDENGATICCEENHG